MLLLFLFPLCLSTQHLAVCTSIKTSYLYNVRNNFEIDSKAYTALRDTTSQYKNRMNCLVQSSGVHVNQKNGVYICQ